MLEHVERVDEHSAAEEVVPQPSCGGIVECRRIYVHFKKRQRHDLTETAKFRVMPALQFPHDVAKVLANLRGMRVAAAV
jgi:hypothetical protein